ncbi:winged helix-turn-helix domain-containing protein [Bradyrhizobium monzae]|uniref:winged helix-turn-helix domain-containing protein n=1 Tax=Bradyrhizobium sp. Oc8 TaxID=2876780 RepID=UPI001F1AEE3E|nr:winged helix-turn-helix domain-containing protein [Bradyrhizobium sp. Oc8]
MRYFFEDCVLDTDLRELRRGCNVVATTPQVFDLLTYLIRNRDHVVSKDDLVDAIWSGRIVSDAALTTRLNAVRRAIGDSGEQQRLIKTFPRKGFRFVGAVQDEDRQPEAATDGTVSVRDLSEKAIGRQQSDGRRHPRDRWQLTGRALTAAVVIGTLAFGLTGYRNVGKTVPTDVIRAAQNIQPEPTVRSEGPLRLSIVVLPFANLNNDPEQDHLADAITADLAAHLARTPATFVVGRETASAYKNRAVALEELGTRLGVRWAVQGAVKRTGDRVRVNVSLTDLQNAHDIWSDWFDGDDTNLAGLQANIAARLLCVAHLHLRHYEEAIEQCSRSLNITGVKAYISLIRTRGSKA